MDAATAVAEGSAANHSAADTGEANASDAHSGAAPEPESTQDDDRASTTSSTSRGSTFENASVSASADHRLLWRLEKSLAAVDYAGVPYRADECELPAPGLVVNGLPDPLALPLIPTQAEQLAAVGARISARNCFLVEPDELMFENPDWEDAVEELMGRICFSLGWPKGCFRCELYGLVLYGATGCLDLHAHTEKANSEFATLTIQLPSHFKGGEVSLRYNDREDILEHGADDGTNGFKSLYSFRFADMKEEMRPVKEGYRLTLIYDVLWIGKGTAPTANADHMAQVAAALQEHADKSAVGDWYLAFMLEHEYSSASLSTHGIEALKEMDRRNIGALTTAAEMIGIGELDFVLCKLSNDLVICRDAYVPPTNMSYSDTNRVQAVEAYWDTGESFEGDLHWVDLDFVSFTPGKPKFPFYNDCDIQVHLCNSMVVIIWAKSRKVEALFNEETYDVGCFLNDEDLSLPSYARADRMLGCIERRGPVHYRDWYQTKEVLEFCLERALHEQASRGIRIASTFNRTEDIEMVLFHYVSRYGWEVVGDALEHYLCCRRIPKRCSIVFRLSTLFQLMPWMPIRITLDALAMIVKFLERHERSRLGERHSCRPALCDSKKYHRKIWVTLMSVMAELELNCAEFGISSSIDGLAVRLGTVIESFDETEASEGYNGMLSQEVIRKAARHLEELHAVFRKRFLCIRREKFEKLATCVIKHKTTPRRRSLSTPYDRRFADSRPNRKRERDWVKFISLSPGVASGEGVSATTSTLVEEMLNTIALLCRRDIDALQRAIHSFESDSEEEKFCLLFEDKIPEALPDIG